MDSYKDRTNSTNAQIEPFESFGAIRYTKTRQAWVATHEPLCPATQRALEIDRFFENASINQTQALVFPISDRLARELKSQGFYIQQIGAEPIFNLKDYFLNRQTGLDPVLLDPKTHKIQRLGYTCEGSVEAFSDPHSIAYGLYTQASEIHPRSLVATAKASPLTGKAGYTISDCFVEPQALSGTTEFFYIEIMRDLYKRGVLEVRLGLAPLARIEGSDGWSRLLRFAFKYGDLGYSFAKRYSFKEGLHPTVWAPLYLASRNRIEFATWDALLEAHWPNLGATEILIHTFLQWFRSTLTYSLQNPANEKIGKLKTIPNTAWDWTKRSSAALWIAGFLFFLDLIRGFSTSIDSIASSSGYKPLNLFAVKPMFLSPLFHNTPFHLWGNIIGLIFFGGLVQTLLGTQSFLSVLGLGLFLSNPLTELLFANTLPLWNPSGWQHFLLVNDFGASNGIFSCLGAITALLKSPHVLAIPLVTFSLISCAVQNNWVSFHHTIALGLGYAWVKLLAHRI